MKSVNERMYRSVLKVDVVQEQRDMKGFMISRKNESKRRLLLIENSKRLFIITV